MEDFQVDSANLERDCERLSNYLYSVLQTDNFPLVVTIKLTNFRKEELHIVHNNKPATTNWIRLITAAQSRSAKIIDTNNTLITIADLYV